MPTLYSRLPLSAITLLSLLLGACSGDSLQTIEERGELRIVTRNGPTTYYIDRQQPAGFEFALARRFANHLGVRLRVKAASDLEQLFADLDRADVDIAAAGLTISGAREDRFEASTPYAETAPLVVYRAGNFRPRSVNDLYDGRLLVMADSSHEHALLALRDGGRPQLQWDPLPLADSLDLLGQVDAGQADYAVIDANDFAVQQSLYPRLRTAFELGNAQPLAWFLPRERDNARLLARLNAFFDELQRNGELQRMREQHFGHTQGVTRIGSHTFNLSMRRTLPRYRGLIEQVANEYQMEWHLLAAVAYQESHWDPQAVSPTGVRGMMMLTRITASELGVDDREDPLQSLRGGARYLKNLKRRLPGSINEPDRTWFSLAAYNIGMGHLRDARMLTEKAGADPNRWADVARQLPLLQQSQYYRQTKYGYARGSEAATYVQNIRHYYSILRWQDLAANQPPPPGNAADYLPAALKNTPLRAL